MNVNLKDADSKEEYVPDTQGFLNPLSVGLVLTPIIILFILGWLLIAAGVVGIVFLEAEEGTLYQLLYPALGVLSAFCGIVCLMISLTMFIKGIRTADEPPSKAWVLTIFGKMSNVMVKKWPILLFDYFEWLEILGYEEVNLDRADEILKLKKDLRCKDGLYIIAEDSGFSIGFQADDRSAQSLKDHINIGHKAGFIKQVDGMLTVWMEQICKENTSDWIEENSIDIIEMLLVKLEGTEGTEASEKNNNEYDDTRGLGTRIKKLQPWFAIPKEIRTARNKIGIEKAQRPEEIADMETWNALAITLYNNYILSGDPRTLKECYEEITTLRALRANNYQELRTGSRGGSGNDKTNTMAIIDANGNRGNNP